MQLHEIAPIAGRKTLAVAPALHIAQGDSALGPFTVAVAAHGIAALLFGSPAEAAEDLQRRFDGVALIEDRRGLADIVAKIAALIGAPASVVDLSLAPKGTAFQQRVWQALRQIPCGATASYAEIARRIGAPRSMRAVAQACAANPIAVAIPCHRVVRSDGSLGGYRWGIERKAVLLRAEGAL